MTKKPTKVTWSSITGLFNKLSVIQLFLKLGLFLSPPTFSSIFHLFVTKAWYMNLDNLDSRFCLTFQLVVTYNCEQGFAILLVNAEYRGVKTSVSIAIKFDVLVISFDNNIDREDGEQGMMCWKRGLKYLEIGHLKRRCDMHVTISREWHETSLEMSTHFFEREMTALSDMLCSWQ
jgi:hypothetical protein